MGVEKLAELLEQVSLEDLQTEQYRGALIRSAYGKGYTAALGDDQPLTPDEARAYEREQWARLPIP